MRTSHIWHLLHALAVRPCKTNLTNNKRHFTHHSILSKLPAHMDGRAKTPRILFEINEELFARIVLRGIWNGKDGVRGIFGDVSRFEKNFSSDDQRLRESMMEESPLMLHGKKDDVVSTSFYQSYCHLISNSFQLDRCCWYIISSSVYASSKIVYYFKLCETNTEFLHFRITSNQSRCARNSLNKTQNFVG